MVIVPPYVDCTLKDVITAVLTSIVQFAELEALKMTLSPLAGSAFPDQFPAFDHEPVPALLVHVSVAA